MGITNLYWEEYHFLVIIFGRLVKSSYLCINDLI